MIYETETDDAEFLIICCVQSGRSRIKAAQTVADSGVSALYPRCGQNAAEVLTAAGILIFKTETLS